MHFFAVHVVYFIVPDPHIKDPYLCFPIFCICSIPWSNINIGFKNIPPLKCLIPVKTTCNLHCWIQIVPVFQHFPRHTNIWPLPLNKSEPGSCEVYPSCKFMSEKKIVFWHIFSHVYGSFSWHTLFYLYVYLHISIIPMPLINLDVQPNIVTFWYVYTALWCICPPVARGPYFCFEVFEAFDFKHKTQKTQQKTKQKNKTKQNK